MENDCYCGACNLPFRMSNSSSNVTWNWIHKIPTPKKTSKKENKMAKESWKLVAKDADSTGSYDKHGNYKSKVIDYVEEFENFAGALQAFLQWIDDYAGETGDKVSLVYVPAKKK